MEASSQLLGRQHELEMREKASSYYSELTVRVCSTLIAIGSHINGEDTQFMQTI
jgi:hypothetical protein